MVERMTPRGTEGGAYVPAFAETHSGLVFFVGDRAYKLKKDVDLGFLDFTSREKRLAACRARGRAEPPSVPRCVPRRRRRAGRVRRAL